MADPHNQALTAPKRRPGVFGELDNELSALWVRTLEEGFPACTGAAVQGHSIFLMIASQNRFYFVDIELMLKSREDIFAFKKVIKVNGLSN